MALVFSPANMASLLSRPTDLAANVQDNIHMEDILSTESRTSGATLVEVDLHKNVSI